LTVHHDDLTFRPITGPDELDLFNRFPHQFNEELAGDLADGHRPPDRHDLGIAALTQQPQRGWTPTGRASGGWLNACRPIPARPAGDTRGYGLRPSWPMTSRRGWPGRPRTGRASSAGPAAPRCWSWSASG